MPSHRCCLVLGGEFNYFATEVSLSNKSFLVSFQSFPLEGTNCLDRLLDLFKIPRFEGKFASKFLKGTLRSTEMTRGQQK